MNRCLLLILAVAALSPVLRAASPATQPASRPVNAAAAQPANAAVPKLAQTDQVKAAVQAPVAQVQAVRVQAAAVQLRAAVALNNNIKAQRDAQRQNIKNTPDGGTFKLEDLVRFSLSEGRLKSEWVGKIPAGQARRIKIEGSDATWLVNRFNAGPNAYFNLTRFDFDGPEDGFWMCQLSCQEGVNVTSIYAQGGETSEVSRIFFTQQPNAITINLQGMENNRPRQILTATAQNLFQLRNDHPDEVCRHLIPVLRKITGQPLLRPGAGDVYRVFTAIPADSAVTRKIEAILPALTSIDPIERDKAMQSLRDLGPAAALAALRLDPDLLLPEQVNRLSALVAFHSRVLVDDPAQALKDPNFLIDCFEDDDLAVRVAAKDAFESLMNRKIDFDPSAPLAQRTAVADALRIRLSQIAAQRREFEKFEIP